MPIALVAAAWLLVMTGINGDESAVGQQFETDVFGSGGSGGFLNFLAGILGIAIFFRVIGMPTVGRAFLILALIVFILQNPNVLTAFENIGSSTSTSTTASGSSTNIPAAQTASNISSLLNTVNQISNSGVSNATPLTTPAPGTGSGGIGSA
jgi:hypothetical protein